MFKYGLYRFLALVVRVAYLIALYSAVYLMFFHTGVTENGMGEAFALVIPVAVLLHEFLQQGVFITLFRTFMRNQKNDDLKGQVRFHGVVMFALTCFDAFCAWQISPAAIILPALFFVSSLLVEADEDAGGLLARQAHAMQMQTTRVNVRQWRARMRRARKLGINLAPVAAALMRDAGNEADAKRIEIIDNALTAAERTHPIPMREHGWLYNLFHRGQQRGGNDTQATSLGYVAALAMPAASLDYATQPGRYRGSDEPSFPGAEDDFSPFDGERERYPRVVPALTGSGSEAPSEQDVRKASQYAARRAAAFVILDANPGMTREQLRKALKCRQETANGLYTAWQLDRGAQARTRKEAQEA